MTTKRSYKDVIPKERALQILEEEAGKQFDPKLVPVFVCGMQKGRIQMANEACESNCQTYAKHALIRESFSVLAWGNSHLFAEDTGKIPKVMETDAGCDLADLQGRDVQIINCPSDPLLPDVGSDGHAGLLPEIAGE